MAWYLATLVQCSTQRDKFICAPPRTVYSDEIRVINPNRVLTDVYSTLTNAFWIGVEVAVSLGLLRIKYRNRWKWFDWPLIGCGTIFCGAT